jgi:hypothetical protein
MSKVEKPNYQELVEIEPDERTLKLLNIPIQIEHFHEYEDLETAKRLSPVISTVYQVKEHPDVYVVRDTNRDQYVIGLKLSEKEQRYIEEHSEEYEANRFHLFAEDNLPKRWIHKIRVRENGVERDIDISYSLMKFDSDNDY